jgi:hypothetical protein
LTYKVSTGYVLRLHNFDRFTVRLGIEIEYPCPKEETIAELKVQ